MPGKLDATLVRKAVRSGAPNLIQRLLEKLDTSDLTLLLPELSPHELRVVAEELLREQRFAATLNALPEDLLLEVVANLDTKLMARALARLELDDACRVAHRLDEDYRRRVFAEIAPERASQIARLMRYAPESAGGRMIPRYVAVNREATVGDAVRAVRQAPPEVPLFYLYVVDEAERLVGVTSLSRLVRSQDDTPIAELIDREVVTVPPEADQEEVARLVSRMNLLAIPVVEEGRLLGLVTVDDVIDVLEQEATEDMYNMAGLSEGDRVFSPPHRSLIKRLPWNTLNLVTSILAALVIARFQSTLDKLLALTIFMPVVAGLGGNTGNQTLTVIIRGITLGELEFSSALRAMAKEISVGLGIGLLLGSTVALIAYVWVGNPMLGLVVALAIVANLFVAALVGTAIPLTLKRLGQDPALGGSILVTMCTDVFGFFVFLGLAALFMQYLI